VNDGWAQRHATSVNEQLAAAAAVAAQSCAHWGSSAGVCRLSPWAETERRSAKPQRARERRGSSVIGSITGLASYSLGGRTIEGADGKAQSTW
jgi:hypothetical protein